MRDLKYYMSKPYRIEIIPEQREGGFVVYYPELKGCISQGETLEAALKNAEDAKREWFLSMMDENLPIPDADAERNFSGTFRIRIPKELHQRLYYLAKDSGVSMNQYCTMLLSQAGLQRK